MQKKHKLTKKDISYNDGSFETFSEFSMITTGANNFVPLGSNYIYITSLSSNVKTPLLEDDIPPDKSILISSEVQHLMRRIPPDKTYTTSYASCTESTSSSNPTRFQSKDIYETSCDSNGITTRADNLVSLGFEPSRITSPPSIQKTTHDRIWCSS